MHGMLNIKVFKLIWLHAYILHQSMYACNKHNDKSYAACMLQTNNKNFKKRLINF